MKFKIVRLFKIGAAPQVVRRGLTLVEAQAHCQDPETSSRTARSKEARQLTEQFGPWFDGYDRDTPEEEHHERR